MAEPLRILQVLRAPVGGLFRHVGDVTRALSARGHQIGILADNLATDALSEQRLGALAPYATLGIHRLPMPRVIGPNDLTTPFAVRRLADQLNIAVAHGHGAKGGLNARFTRMGVAGRVALYTPHGGVLNYRPGSTAGKVFRGAERLLLGQTDAIVFESAFAQDAYRRMIAQPTCPAPVIHNGVTPAEFEPVIPNPDAADFVYIGEFRPVKGIGFLIEALASVTAPDGRPATLIMAGSGPDLEQARAQIAALALGERVTLAGVQPARQMLARGRCVVVPSLAESLPYVILEAASAGRPVISTGVGGIAEIFGPTADRLLPPANAVALRDAMQAHLADPAGAERDVATRLAFVRENFSVEHMTDQIEALYRQVLAARRAS